MAVPVEIRQVKRPMNTIVVDSGRDGPCRYAVRERAGVRYVPGGNPQPKNGKVIGHIVDGRYVPKDVPASETRPERLSFGAAAFAHSVSGDLLSDLLAAYAPEDACRIMAIAEMRAVQPSIRSSRLAYRYSLSFTSKFYPGCHLSENTVRRFLQALGEAGSRRKKFFRKRLGEVTDGSLIVIDGTFRQQDSGRPTDLSAFSRKARAGKYGEISVCYKTAP